MPGCASPQPLSMAMYALSSAGPPEGRMNSSSFTAGVLPAAADGALLVVLATVVAAMVATMLDVMVLLAPVAAGVAVLAAVDVLPMAVRLLACPQAASSDAASAAAAPQDKRRIERRL